MRAMPPPPSYPQQLFPYPTHGGAVPVYAPPPPNIQAGHLPQPNGIQGRASNMSMMSPVMQTTHANHPAIYSSSPVLMHSPAILPAPANHGYHSVPQNRPHVRAFEHSPAMPGIPPINHPQPQSGPYAVTPTTYSRPAW